MLITEQKVAAAAGRACSSLPPTARQAATGYSQTEDSRWTVLSTRPHICGQEAIWLTSRTCRFIFSKFIAKSPKAPSSSHLTWCRYGPGKSPGREIGLPGPCYAVSKRHKVFKQVSCRLRGNQRSSHGRGVEGRRRSRGRPVDPLAETPIERHLEILGLAQVAQRLEEMPRRVGRELLVKIMDLHWRSSPLEEGYPFLFNRLVDV